MSGTHVLSRRCKAIRELVPGCGLKDAKEWLDSNLPNEE